MKDSLQFFLEKIPLVSSLDLIKYRYVIGLIYPYLPDHIVHDCNLSSELHEIDMLLRDMIDTLNGEYEPYYDDEE